MTVKELIKHLKKLDQDDKVYYYDANSSQLYSITSVNLEDNSDNKIENIPEYYVKIS